MAGAVDPKQELEELLSRQHQIEDTLANLERQIFEYEGSYLEETQIYGNLFRGFDGFSNSSNVGDSKHLFRKFRQTDRLFSLSSCTSSSAVENGPDGDAQHTSSKKGAIFKRAKKASLLRRADPQ
eukprot:CFRG6838T1